MFRREPTVSVLLPIYKEPDHYIKQSIESILNQTFQDFELLIIMDTGRISPDFERIYETVRSYKDDRIVLVINERNLGLPQTLNKGVDLAKGKYIARQDADDVSLSHRLETQLEFLKCNPYISLCVSRVYHICNNGNRIKVSRRLSSSSLCIWLFSGFNVIYHPTWMGISEVFRKYKYREIKAVEDYDFLLRLCMDGEQIGIINEPLVEYRVAYRKDRIGTEYRLLQLKLSIYIAGQARMGKIADLNEINSVINESASNSIIESLANIMEQKFARNKILRKISFLISPYRFKYATLGLINYTLFRLGVKKLPIKNKNTSV